MSKINKSKIAGHNLDGLSGVAREIAEGLLNAKAHIEGSDVGARVTRIDLPDPAPGYRPNDVRRIRKRLGLTQAAFARLMNVSVKSIEGWEAGRKSPGPASRRILQLTTDREALATLADVAGFELIEKR